jgi:hypothetical protein
VTREGQLKYRLWHFRLTPAGPALKAEHYLTQLFFEAKPPLSVTGVERLTSTWRAVVRGGQISVQVRRDASFADVWEFPAILPFVLQPNIPYGFQYMTSGKLNCSQVMEEPVSCAGNNFRR